MGANPRTKGGTGEREIAEKLNTLVWMVNNSLDLPQHDKPFFQRNQNQSAVGGDDLVSPMPLSIEVKRQEALSINTWWKQCLTSAGEHKHPILLFRQNRKKWRCCMLGWLPGKELPVRVEISIDDFEDWFMGQYESYISSL